MTFWIKNYSEKSATLKLIKKKPVGKTRWKENRNMHEKVSPFVSKTLSKITTIIYISTKIFGFKNSCNEKTGGYFFLTVKKWHCGSEICKICNEKNKICII